MINSTSQSCLVADDPFLFTPVIRYDLRLVKFLKDIEFLPKKYLNQIVDKHLQKKVTDISELSKEDISIVSKVIQKQKITDLSQISKKQLSRIVEFIERKFEEIEQKSPAEGYRFYIEAGTLNEVEMYIEAYGKRQAESSIKIPQINSCPFCAKVLNNTIMEKYKNLCSPLSKVIQTGQGNPLVISAEHKDSFFQLSNAGKVSMIRTAYKVFLANNPPGKNFLFHTHYGEGLNLGHQNVPHAHGHVKGALTEKPISLV